MTNRFTLNSVNTGNQPISVEVIFEGQRVSQARLGVRGFWDLEKMLEGKDPYDCLQVVLRINAGFSVAHGLAAARALEEAGGIKMTQNGLLARNILQACEFIHHHLAHFYQGLLFTFAASPFGEEVFTGPISPEKNRELEESFWQFFVVRARLQEMMALLSGRAPNHITIVPGGLSDIIDISKILRLQSYLNQVEAFVQNVYQSNLRLLVSYYSEWAETSLPGNTFISVGGFSQKVLKSGQEEDQFWLSGALVEGTRKEFHAEKVAAPKNGVLSSIVGRYDGRPVETGVLARRRIKEQTIVLDNNINPTSVLGREMLRIKECKELLSKVKSWINKLDAGQPLADSGMKQLKEAKGQGIVESAAGPVIHTLTINKGRIVQYELVDPISFNFSTKDSSGQTGPVEKALESLYVENVSNPIEIIRVIRAFE